MKWSKGFCLAAVLGSAGTMASTQQSPAQIPATAPAQSAPQGQGVPATPGSVPEGTVPPAQANPTTTTPTPAQAGAPAAPDTSPKTSAWGMVDASSYVIGADDVLQITVWKEPSLSGNVPVRPDGMISLVLLGDVPAAGRTPMKLAEDVTNRLKKYIQDPNVSVLVSTVNSQRIFLVGEIGHVGALNLSPGMSVLQAIAAAGGPSPYGNTKHIYILRGTGGSQQKIPFNYKKALKGDTSQKVALQPGDTIVIP